MVATLRRAPALALTVALLWGAVDGVCVEPGSGEFIESACAGSLQVSTILANCSEPPEGSFVVSPCVAGNHSSTLPRTQDDGENTTLALCNTTQPGPGYFVQTGCRPGSVTAAGSDTVFAVCFTPAEGSYVSAACRPGNATVWPMVAGANTAISECTVVDQSRIAFGATSTCSGPSCTDEECCTVPPTCLQSRFVNNSVCANETDHLTPGHLLLFDPDGTCSGVECTYNECCRAPGTCADSVFGDDSGCAAVVNTTLRLSNATGLCVSYFCTAEECCAAPAVCADSNFTTNAGCAWGDDPSLEIVNSHGICQGLACTQTECCDRIQLCAQSNFTNSSGCVTGPDPELTVGNVNGNCTDAHCTQAECCLAPQTCGNSSYETDAQCDVASGGALLLRNNSGLCIGLECSVEECCQTPQLCSGSNFTSNYDCACADNPTFIDQHAATCSEWVGYSCDYELLVDPDYPSYSPEGATALRLNCPVACELSDCGRTSNWDDELLTVFDVNGTCQGAGCTHDECCDNPTGQLCGTSAFANNAGCAAGSDTNLNTFNEFGKCRTNPCAQAECCIEPPLCGTQQFDSDAACAAASSGRPVALAVTTPCAGATCLQIECCTVPQLCSESSYTTNGLCAAAAVASDNILSLTRLGITATSCAGTTCTQAECCQMPQDCTASVNYNSDQNCYANSVNRSLLAFKGGTCTRHVCDESDNVLCCAVPMSCTGSVWTGAGCSAGPDPALAVFSTNYAPGRTACTGVNCTQSECCVAAQTCPSSSFANANGCISNGAPNMSVWTNRVCAGLTCTMEECCAVPQQCSETAYATHQHCWGGSLPIYNSSGVCIGLQCTAEECCVPSQVCSASDFSSDALCAGGPEPLLNTLDPAGSCATDTCSQDDCCYSPAAELCNVSAFQNNSGCASGADPARSIIEAAGTCINTTCLQAECCQAPETCLESDLNGGGCEVLNTSIVLFNSSNICAGPTCEAAECCYAPQTCHASEFNSDSACSTLGGGDLSASASWGSGSWASLDTVALAFDPDGSCGGTFCELDECCTEPQNCSDSGYNVGSDSRRRGCGIGFYITSTEAGMEDFQCVGANCTYGECCVRSEECAASDYNSTASCATFAATGNYADGALTAYNASGSCIAECPTAECQKCNQTECCAPPETCAASSYASDATCTLAASGLYGFPALQVYNETGVCSETSCNQSDCCQVPQRCEDSHFSSQAACAVAGEDVNRTVFVVGGSCTSAACQLEECCVKPQLCGDVFSNDASCAAKAVGQSSLTIGFHLTVRDMHGVCESENCTQNECCENPNAMVCRTEGAGAAAAGEMVWTDPVCQHSVSGINTPRAVVNPDGKCMGDCDATECCVLRQNCTAKFSEIGGATGCVLAGTDRIAFAPLGCTRLGCSVESQATAAAGGYCRGADCAVEECCVVPQQCTASLYSSDLMCNITNPSLPYFNETGACAGIECTVEECCHAPKSCALSSFNGAACAAEYTAQEPPLPIVRVIQYCVAGSWDSPGADVRVDVHYAQPQEVPADDWRGCNGAEGLFDALLHRGGVCLSEQDFIPPTCGSCDCADSACIQAAAMQAYMDMQPACPTEASRCTFDSVCLSAGLVFLEAVFRADELNADPNPCATGNPSFQALHECNALADNDESTVVCSDYRHRVRPPVTFSCNDGCALTFAKLPTNCSVTLGTYSDHHRGHSGHSSHNDTGDVSFSQAAEVFETCSARVAGTGPAVVLDKPTVRFQLEARTSGQDEHGKFSPGHLLTALLRETGSAVWITQARLSGPAQRPEGMDSATTPSHELLTQLTLSLAARDPAAMLASLNASVTAALSDELAYPRWRSPGDDDGLLVSYAASDYAMICAASEVEFATAACTGILQGEDCSYECRAGYLASGTHHCAADGTMGGGSCVMTSADAPVVSTSLSLSGAAVSRSGLQAALIEQYGDKAQLLNFVQQARLSMALPLDLSMFNTSTPLGQAIGFSVRKSAAAAACPIPCDSPVSPDSVTITSVLLKSDMVPGTGRRRRLWGEAGQEAGQEADGELWLRRRLAGAINGTEVALLIEHSEDLSDGLNASGTGGFLASFAAAFNAVEDADLPPALQAALPAGWDDDIPSMDASNMTVTAAPQYEQHFEVALVADESMTTACGPAATTRRLGEHLLSVLFCPSCMAQDSLLLSPAGIAATKQAVQAVQAPRNASLTCADELLSELNDPSKMSALFAAAGVTGSSGAPLGKCVDGVASTAAVPCFVTTVPPVVQCGVSLPHAQATAPCPMAGPGTQCNFSCADGFQPVGAHVCRLSGGGTPEYSGGSCSLVAVAATSFFSMETVSSLTLEERWAIGLSSAAAVVLLAAGVGLKAMKGKRASAAVGVNQAPSKKAMETNEFDGLVEDKPGEKST